LAFILAVGTRALRAGGGRKAGVIRYQSGTCPERAFVSLRLKKMQISVECFSRGVPLAGTKVSNVRFSPRWARFSIRSNADAEGAIQILTESYQRIKEALKSGEPTMYFSGGEHLGREPDRATEDDQD
jgi:hypothetical protein